MLSAGEVMDVDVIVEFESSSGSGVVRSGYTETTQLPASLEAAYLYCFNATATTTTQSTAHYSSNAVATFHLLCVLGIPVHRIECL